MNRILLLVVVFSFVQMDICAQESNYKMAIDFTKNYKTRPPDYKKAKEYIDLASSDDKLQSSPDFWYNKGKIYNNFYLKEAEYNSKEQVDEVLEIYGKCQSLDKAKKYQNGIILDCKAARTELINRGVQLFNQENLEKAYYSYIMGMQFSTFLNETDSVAAFYAAAAADHMESYNNALKWYKVCDSLGYRGLESCMSMMRIYKALQQEGNYRAQVKSCQHNYPDNKTLLLLEVNRLYEEAKHEEALSMLNKALEEDPNDPEIHFALGVGYDYNSEPDKAEGSYMKAIELRQGYFDALYNLGSHYYNIASYYNRQLEGVSDPDKYLKLNAEVDKWLKKALIYLEKANNIWDTEMATLEALKQIYGHLEMMTEYRETSLKINTLQAHKQN